MSCLRPSRRAAVAWLAAAALPACTPTLDWRDVRPQGGSVQALFPCKPSNDVRSIALAGAPVRLSLQACQADGASYALSVADVQDPARVAATLEALRVAAGANLSATPAVAASAAVPGMTPNPQAQRLAITGRLPDGTPVREELLLFVHGTVVYQAAVLGAHPDRAAVDTFFEGLRFAP